MAAVDVAVVDVAVVGITVGELVAVDVAVVDVAVVDVDSGTIIDEVGAAAGEQLDTCNAKRVKGPTEPTAGSCTNF